MPLSFGTSEKKGYTPVPAGTHIGLWAGIVDVGFQDSQLIGSFPKPPRHEVAICFEFPTELIDIGGEQKAARKWNLVTASMEGRAKLRKWVELTIGKMTDESAGQFDLFSMIGNAALITVSHKPSKTPGKVYDNIDSMAPLMKGMTAPALTSPPIVFGGDQTSSLEQVPTWIRALIDKQLPADVFFAKRKAFFQARDEKEAGGAQEAAQAAEDFNDEVPF